MAARKTGWVKDTFDQRDYRFEGKEVASIIKRLQSLRHINKLLEELPSHLLKIPKNGPYSTGVAHPSSIEGIIDELKRDVAIISVDLSAGVDLVTAKTVSTEDLEPDASKECLVPPVSAKLLQAIREAKNRLDQPISSEQNDSKTEALPIATVEQVIRELMPIALHRENFKANWTEFMNRLIAIVKNYKPNPQQYLTLDKQACQRLPHHLLVIYPDSMHELGEAMDSVRLPLSANHFNNHASAPFAKVGVAENHEDVSQPLYLFLPRVVDLSLWCPAVKDQGDLNTCTIYAIAALVEYFQCRTSGQLPRPTSTRFLYKVARRMTERVDRERILPFLKIDKYNFPKADFHILDGVTETLCEKAICVDLLDIPQAATDQGLEQFVANHCILDSENVAERTILQLTSERYSIRVFVSQRKQYITIINRETSESIICKKPVQCRLPAHGMLVSFSYIAHREDSGKTTTFIVTLNLNEERVNRVLQLIRTRHGIQAGDFHERLKEYIQASALKGEAAFRTVFDVGASIRQTLKALMLFGIPPAEYWPEQSDSSLENHSGSPKGLAFDEEPPPFCYAFAQNFKATKYFRLDYLHDFYSEQKRAAAVEAASILGETVLELREHPSVPPNFNVDRSDIGRTILVQIKAVLAAGFPVVFGFPYHEDLLQPKTGDIQVPEPQFIDRLVKTFSNTGLLGHAVLAIGYDDSHPIFYQGCPTTVGKGAFLIQNSWGRDAWGHHGYGWLPYDYVLEGLARDWWSLLNTEWVETGEFVLDNQFGRRKKTPGGA